MKKKMITIVLCAFVAVSTNGCADLERFKKDVNSQFSNGLEREIIVRNISGEVMEHYEGKFDVSCNGTRIKFIDENGKLHLIYLSEVNTVTITEK